MGEMSETPRATPVLPPGGLVPEQRRPKVVRLVKGGDWYAAGPGRLDLVGSGDLSVRDLAAVGVDLERSSTPWTVFVCVARPKEVEDVLGPKGTFGTKRITWSRRMDYRISPKVSAIARGARIALLPDAGVVWVDGERLFRPGEAVPLPWTDPPLSLVVVRPSVVRRALDAAVGPGGPKRALLQADG